MNLQEVFDQLSVGELSMLSVGGNDQGVIDEGNWDKVLPHINLGLTALYQRFALRWKERVIPLVSGTTIYVLDDPELMKMEQVLTDSLVELPLNLEGDPFTVQTSDLRTLVVPTLIVEQSRDLPDALKTGNLLVKYRAKHPTVVLAPAQNPDDVDLMLPDTHLEALLYFIASRLHTPVGMLNEGNLPNIWYSKYQAECMKLEQKNLQIDQVGTNDRLRRGGWV